VELVQQILLALVVAVGFVLSIGFLAVCGLAAVMGTMVYGGIALARFMDLVVMPVVGYGTEVAAPFVRRHAVAAWTWSTPHRQWVRRHPFLTAASAGALAIASVTGYGLWYIYLSPGDEPDPMAVLRYEPPAIGRVTDARGEVYFRMATEYRSPVAFTAIPEHVRNAFIAAEDKNFWTHSGWNWSRTAVATWKAFTTRVFGYRPQGASAIPQQVARKLYPALVDMVHRERDDEPLVHSVPVRALALVKGQVFANRTARKWREIRYAVRMQAGLEEYFRKNGHPNPHRAAKEAILGTYLNMPYFGHGVYGVQYAAQFYFRKELADLTVEEAAFLASLLPAPNRYAALDEPSAAMTARRNEVLRRMADNGFLAPERFRTASATPVTVYARAATVKTAAPAAVNFALLRELPAAGQTQGDLLRGRIQVRTTLRMDIQRIVNRAVHHGMYGNGTKGSGWTGRYPDTPVPQITVVVLGPRGDILAMHGGEVRDPAYRFNAHMQLNRALTLQQPGSTIKIVDNLAAVMAGFTPDTLVSDAPIAVCMRRGNDGRCIDSKQVANYENEHHGTLPLREWSARSVNTPYMRLMKDMVGAVPEAQAEAAVLRERLGRPVDPGAAWMLKWARETGITTPLQPYISTVLGGSDVTVLEMANVIRAVDTGTRAVPYLVDRVTTDDGLPLFEHPGTVAPMPVPPEKLSQVQALLYGNVRLPEGTGHSLDTAEFGIEVAGKTGTSNDWRDAWYVGYTHGGIYVAVHVGYDDNRPMPGDGLPIWRRASGGWVALPVFREILEQCYGPGKPLGMPPEMPEAVKADVNAYLAKTYPKLAK